MYHWCTVVFEVEIFFNGCFILLGLNADVWCVITSSSTAWKAFCVIILGIWNNALVFLLGAGTEGSSSTIIA